jgi:hypothetical protein
VTRWNPTNSDPIIEEPVKLLNLKLNYQIIDRALKLLVKQLEYTRDEVVYNQPYTGRFEAIHDMPCYYSLRELKARKITLTKHHFHSHWHFKREATITLPPQPAPPSSSIIFAPYKVITRGRRREDRSIRRNQSQFKLTAGPSLLPRLGRVSGETSRVSNLSSNLLT